MAALIHVAPVSPSLEPGVRALRPRPALQPYIGNLAFNLNDAQSDPQSQPFAILADAQVIGYFRLDHAVDRDADNPGQAAIMRTFALDASADILSQQALRALHTHVRRRWPHLQFLIASVNCMDRETYAHFRTAGYIDTGGLIQSRRLGPQHLMQICLQPPAPARGQMIG